ncbi:MAG: hypothetical protein WC624_06980 [Candidatus Margulisiibacteriota bacterium]
MSTEVQICSNRNVRIDAKAISVSSAKDIVSTNEILSLAATLNEALKATADTDAVYDKKFDENNKPYRHEAIGQDAYTILQTNLMTIGEGSVISNYVKALEMTIRQIGLMPDQPPAKKADMAEDQKKLSQVLAIAKRLAGAIDQMKATLPDDVWSVYQKYEKDSKESGQIPKIIDALKQTINELGRKLSQKAKTTLKISGDLAEIVITDERFQVRAGNFINSNCLEAQPKATPRIVKPLQPQPQPQLPQMFFYNIRLGSGYYSGKDVPLSPGAGVVGEGGLTLRYGAPKSTSYQFDYTSGGAYVGGNDKVTRAHDEARASIRGQNYYVSAGYVYDRRDIPTPSAPNYGDSFAQRSRLRFGGDLAFTLDQSLMAGSTAATYPATDKHGYFNAFVMPGLSYKSIYLGGLAGIRDGNARFGGFAGMGIRAGKHEVDLRGQYSTGSGQSVITDGFTTVPDGAYAGARYLFTSGEYSFGGRAFYAGGKDQKAAGINLLAIIPVSSRFVLIPSAGIMPGSAFGGGGGLTLQYGDNIPAANPSLSNTLIDSPREGRQ